VRHPAELCYWLGGDLAQRVFASGNELIAPPTKLPESA